jgi:hypothetical protein
MLRAFTALWIYSPFQNIVNPPILLLGGLVPAGCVFPVIAPMASPSSDERPVPNDPQQGPDGEGPGSCVQYSLDEVILDARRQQPEWGEDQHNLQHKPIFGREQIGVSR